MRLARRNVALSAELAKLVIADKALASTVNGKTVIALPAWDRELARFNLSLARPGSDNVFLLLMPSGKWSEVTPEQAGEFFAEGYGGEEALYDHACQRLYLRGKATSADLQEIDPYKKAWQQFAKSACERQVREQREANAFRKAVEAYSKEDRMVTADEARKLAAGAIDGESTRLSDRIKAEELALTRTWRGRLRLARARRAIEHAARQGEFRAEIGRFDYVRARALANYLERQGFDAGADWTERDWMVRVAW